MKAEEVEYNGMTLIKTEAPIVDDRYSCDGCVFYESTGKCTAPKIGSGEWAATDPRYDCFDGLGIWIFYKKI